MTELNLFQKCKDNLTPLLYSGEKKKKKCKDNLLLDDLYTLIN